MDVSLVTRNESKQEKSIGCGSTETTVLPQLFLFWNCIESLLTIKALLQNREKINNQRLQNRPYFALFSNEGKVGEMSFFDTLCAAHYHDEGAMMSLIGQFHPLFRKYARCLNCEDSYHDLVTDFIALVYDMEPERFQSRSDGAVVNYFGQVVYHCCAKRLRRLINRPHERFFSELSREEQYTLEVRTSVEDEYFQYELFADAMGLTSHEVQILRLIYESSKPVIEIASVMGKSRQAVNQVKKRALHKLRQAIAENKAD